MFNKDKNSRIDEKMGIPWWSSDWDSAFSLPRAQVQSLVGELRSQKLRGMAKKKKEKKKKGIDEKNLCLTQDLESFSSMFFV